MQIRNPKPQSIEPQSGEGAEINPEVTSFRGRGWVGRACSGRRGPAKKGTALLPVAFYSRSADVSVVGCGLNKQGRWMFLADTGNGWQAGGSQSTG
jgi:hypothetical protein